MWFPVMLFGLQGNNPGGWGLLGLAISTIGILVLLLWMVRDSHPGENRWGPNPKEELVAAEAISSTA